MSYKLFPGETPFQMRTEAERAKPRPRAPPPGKINPSQNPPLHRATSEDVDATRDWLAHVEAGRIGVK